MVTKEINKINLQAPERSEGEKRTLRKEIAKGEIDGGHTNVQGIADQVMKGEGVSKEDKMKVQSVLFNKRAYTKGDAIKWLRDHNLNPIKPAHETSFNFRYRIRDPKQRKEYKTHKINKDITLVFIEK
jgi:hypothetical protein